MIKRCIRLERLCMLAAMAIGSSKLLSADTVDVRYRALDRERTVRFDVRGLREALRHLSACRWPGVS